MTRAGRAMMLTPLGGAHLKAAISRRDAEHNSPAFDAAGRRLGSFDYTRCYLLGTDLFRASNSNSSFYKVNVAKFDILILDFE